MGKIKHGMTNTRIYTIWSNMKARCLNPNCKEYKWYGARGISIYPEWQENFISFKDWAFNNGYTEKLTLDRIDNDKGYFPYNCRWVDMVTQQNNRRSNKYLTYKGITQTYAEWAREYEIPESNLVTRLKKGWGIEEALNTPKIDNLVDMIGKKYNRLTVIKRVAIPEHIKSRGTYYLCRCDCGTEKVILGRSLRSGNTQSCGCLWVEKNNSKKTKGGG